MLTVEQCSAYISQLIGYVDLSAGSPNSAIPSLTPSRLSVSTRYVLTVPLNKNAFEFGQTRPSSKAFPLFSYNFCQFATTPLKMKNSHWPGIMTSRLSTRCFVNGTYTIELPCTVRYTLWCGRTGVSQPLLPFRYF